MNNEILKTAKEQLLARASRNVSNAARCNNLESIKIFLVLPFIQFLGYDITNPDEMFPDYLLANDSNSVGDLVVLKNARPAILFNVVLSGQLNDEARLRLKNAFEKAASAHQLNMAILTDGLVYEVYTDLKQVGVMDSMPYFSFSMATFAGTKDIEAFLVEDIAFLSQSYFNAQEVFSRAMLVAVRRYGQDAIASFMEGDAFIRMVVEKVAAFKNYDKERVTDSIVGYSKPIILSLLQGFSIGMVAPKPDHNGDPLTTEESAFVDYAVSVIYQFLEKQKTSDTYLKKVHALKEKQFLQLYYTTPSLGVFVAVQDKTTSTSKRWDIRFYASEQPLVIEGNDFMDAVKNSSDFQPLLLKSFTAVVNNIKQ